MIHREAAYSPGTPPVVGNLVAKAPCGCRVVLGSRLDTYDTTTVANPCSDIHDAMMDRFNERLKASLENPTGLPLIEVLDEMLQRIYEEEVQ